MTLLYLGQKVPPCALNSINYTPLLYDQTDHSPDEKNNGTQKSEYEHP